MRNKIFSELVKKFPGLDKKFLGLVADKLAKKVTEESGIEQAITDYDNAASITDLAAVFQQGGDQRVNDAKKEWDKNNPKPGGGKPEDEHEEDEEEEPEAGKPEGGTKKKGARMPTWFKQYKEENDQKLNALLKDKNTATVKSRLKVSLKDIPESFYDEWQLPEKDEEVEAFETKVKTKWEAFTKDNPQQGGKGSGGSGSSHQPNRGTSGTDAKPADKELDEVIDKF